MALANFEILSGNLRVYVGTSTSSYPLDYSLYALNATTGARLWKYTALYSVQSSPAVANGVVYFFDYDGYFWGNILLLLRRRNRHGHSVTAEKLHHFRAIGRTAGSHVE